MAHHARQYHFVLGPSGPPSDPVSLSLSFLLVVPPRHPPLQIGTDPIPQPSNLLYLLTPTITTVPLLLSLLSSHLPFFTVLRHCHFLAFSSPLLPPSYLHSRRTAYTTYLSTSFASLSPTPNRLACQSRTTVHAAKHHSVQILLLHLLLRHLSCSGFPILPPTYSRPSELPRFQ